MPLVGLPVEMDTTSCMSGYVVALLTWCNITKSIDEKQGKLQCEGIGTQCQSDISLLTFDVSMTRCKVPFGKAKKSDIACYLMARAHQTAQCLHWL